LTLLEAGRPAIGSSFDFASLHCIVDGGAGEPVIAIHGFGETSYSWRHLVPLLSQDHVLYRFDLKGHGRSPFSDDGDYSLRTQAEIIYRFIVENDMRNITLIGHSMGGGIALLLAIRMSEASEKRLKALIIVDGISLRQRVPLFIKFLRVPILGYLAARFLPAEFQVRLILRLAYFDMATATPETITEYASNLKRADGPRAIVETAKQMIPNDLDGLIGKYKKIRVPTLLIWGKNDRIVSSEIGVMLNAKIKSSELFVIANCGHCPHEEVPKCVLGKIESFLGHL
jgi:pimeloyl-ACP methyl ester carboxylesterase